MVQFHTGCWNGRFALRCAESPIEHIFVGAPLSREQVANLPIFNFDETLARGKIRQVHGCDLLDLREAEPNDDTTPADGILLLREGGYFGSFVLKTADCLPVLIWSQSEVALVHAGWRGLAHGIVERTCSLMSGPLNVCVGPFAGAESYEVGEEVISEFRDPVASALSNGKFLLDLGGTLRRSLASQPVEQFIISDCDTISDERFFSYRRNRTSERNLLFVRVE
ncbi:MAG: polyphenol oxidase family protein [Bdellovibrionales bacterium]|nr:polyphenol oxidase family protein [Bdellovibrionales bacterium]